MNFNPETIRALTPIILALIGGSIAVLTLFSPNTSDAKTASYLGFAGTAIAGASGLAQSGKEEQRKN